MTQHNLIHEIRHLFARQTATEVVLIKVIVPLLVAFDPKLANELIGNMRTGLNIRVPNDDEELRLIFEEYLSQLVDNIEGNVRAKMPDFR